MEYFFSVQYLAFQISMSLSQKPWGWGRSGRLKLFSLPFSGSPLWQRVIYLFDEGIRLWHLVPASLYGQGDDFKPLFAWSPISVSLSGLWCQEGMRLATYVCVAGWRTVVYADPLSPCSSQALDVKVKNRMLTRPCEVTFFYKLCQLCYVYFKIHLTLVSIS